MKEKPYARMWCRECEDWNGPFYLKDLNAIMAVMREKHYSGFYRVLATKQDISFDYTEKS